MKNPTIAISLTCLALTAASDAGTVALIDFGQSGNGNTTTSESLSGTERFWNNVTEANQPVATAMPLVNTANGASGISLQVSNANTASGFNNYNVNGLATTTGQAAARFYPSSATKNNLYGYTTSDGGSFTAPTGVVTMVFSGLVIGQAYDFYGMAYREATNNRETRYVFTGDGTPTTIDWNAASNTDVFSAPGVVADGSGQITMTLTAGPNNNTSQRFFYLNVLEIATVPEPSSALAGVLGLGLLALRRRR